MLFIPESMAYYEDNWTKLGVSKWKKAMEKIKEHEKTNVHLVAAFKYHITQRNIETCFSEGAKLSWRKEQVAQNRKAVKTMMEVILFLAHQNLAFQGHKEDETSTKKGNFKELIDLIAKYDTTLASQLKQNEKYANYQSPVAQNEMIHYLATVLRNDII